MKADDFKVIQEKVDSMTPPPKIGRIPRKIGSQTGFSAITADEWKNSILFMHLMVYCPLNTFIVGAYLLKPAG